MFSDRFNEFSDSKLNPWKSSKDFPCAISIGLVLEWLAQSFPNVDCIPDPGRRHGRASERSSTVIK